jgi:hypothetical protein
MTRYTKNAHGHYLIHGHKYEILEGSRAQVMHGTAYKTSGGLKKSDLLQNKNGRIVSRKKHATAKKERRLVKAGYGTKKGHFGAVKLASHSGKHRSKKMRSKKMRGGYSAGNNVNPEMVPEGGMGVGTAAFGSGPTPYHLGGKRRRGKKGHRGGSHLSDSLKSVVSSTLNATKSAVAVLPHPTNLVSSPK